MFSSGLALAPRARARPLRQRPSEEQFDRVFPPSSHSSPCLRRPLAGEAVSPARVSIFGNVADQWGEEGLNFVQVGGQAVLATARSQDGQRGLEPATAFAVPVVA